MVAALWGAIPVQGARSGADFLLLEPAAGAAAQAGAYCAQADGLDGLRYNPASLASIDALNISISHANAPGDWTHEWAGLGARFGAFALGGEALISSIKPFELYDLNGNVIDMAQAGSQNLMLAGALQLPGGWLKAGLGLRLFRSQLYKFESQGMAADFGLQFQPKDWLVAFGVAAQNIGFQSAYVTEADALPACLRAGSTAHLSLEQGLGLEPSVDLLAFLDPSRSTELRIGLQADIYQRLALRAGVLRADAYLQTSFGLGVHWDGWGLDYAFIPGNELGATHMIELHIAYSH